jgi:uncharacterized protein YbjT (DUF2867 family)
MIAVIIGSTGLVGSLLLQKLLADNDISAVISVSRRSSNINNNKLKEVLVKDLVELPSLYDELQGDIYFCCLGTTIKDAKTRENFKKIDYDAVLEFAKIAKVNQAKSLTVISAYGANPQSFIFYNRVKGEIEKALENLQLNKLLIFRPSFLIGNRQVLRFGERALIDLLKFISPILPNALKKKLMTPAVDLADAMLREGKLFQEGGIKIFKPEDI